ncbi:hypothetical protein BTHE68_24960 [Burkholderia sp. THE68]|uniref:hypothetical protein n=1 Tax=Burkholderia sp. THE68 TaxID=758782 RepID=UPI0013194B5D|nr:hypothetical protein [Burkholderia sp. THE68]BBU28762.1 hypothetical protein BTHE68_24960 [Burkholderia sp. THE68]
MNLPKPASLDWLDQLIELVVTAQNNDLLVKRIERDTRALLEKRAERPEMCWLLLAFTAFLQGERDECIRCAEAACALANHETMILGNVSSLFGNMGDARRAASYADRLAAVSSGNPRFAIHAARVLCAALHLEAAAQIMHSRGVRHALDEHDSILGEDEFLRDIDNAVDLFQTAGVDADLRVALLESAVLAVRSKGCAIRQVMPILYPEDDTMRYELYAQAPARRCAELSFAIAEALVEKFDDAYPELITFSCRPLTSYRPANTFAESLA